MTIEPSAARFTIGTKVLPPKQPKPVRMPKLSMAEEAELVRIRFARTWSHVGGDNDPNLARRIEAQDRQERLVAHVTELLGNGQMSARRLMAATGAGKHTIGAALRWMQSAGIIVKGDRIRVGHMWRLAE